MEMTTGYVIEIEVLDKRHVGLKSSTMEKKALNNCLQRLQADLNVLEVCTNARCHVTLHLGMCPEKVRTCSVKGCNLLLKRCMEESHMITCALSHSVLYEGEIHILRKMIHSCQQHQLLKGVCPWANSCCSVTSAQSKGCPDPEVQAQSTATTSSVKATGKIAWSRRSLEFQDSDVFDLLQEIGAYLEGHLGQLDMANPPADYLVRWEWLSRQSAAVFESDLKYKCVEKAYNINHFQDDQLFKTQDVTRTPVSSSQVRGSHCFFTRCLCGNCQQMWREDGAISCQEVENWRQFQAVIIAISSLSEDKEPKHAVLLPRKTHALPRTSLPPELNPFMKEVHSFYTRPHSFE
ncbi:hypothetical protein ACROYT_G014578 [Oculina patagonica]